MYTYKATIKSVYDGDSFRADLQLGFGIIDTGSNGKGRAFRLMGVDTPEVRGASKEFGIKVRDYVRELMPEGTEIKICSVKDTTGKYGRYLAYVTIFPEVGEPFDLSEHLLEKGYAIIPDYLK